MTINPADLYFGSYPNYANSPLPVGSIAAINVTSGGSGYTAPNVTIYDAYSSSATGAAATATVVGGTITTITVTSGGTGYIAPIVAIRDSSGVDAAASAVIGNVVPGTGVRKFVDQLPGLCDVSGPTPTLQQCIPIAKPDTRTFQGSDYYQIGLTNYSQKLHSDLPTTSLRGYIDLNPAADGKNHYLGPLILAQRNRPVRILFKNLLPASNRPGGGLMLPVDRTYMGAGSGPDGTTYTDNRANLHLHGGNTPWISDGTPHQWITPAGDPTTLKKGLSFQNVPDMVGSGSPIGLTNPSAGDGKGTYYWPNQQSGRLLWYHDHSYGITRLNVYAGEVAGYLLYDPVQENALAASTVPGTITSSPDLAHLIPLIIQDKTFVDASTLHAQDPTWSSGSNPGSAVTGDLWFPHVYMPNQWPNNPDNSGANPMGRWDYGPWFWPPQDPSTFVPSGKPFPCSSAAVPPTTCPGTPNPTGVPEGFMDTPIINGTAYPVLHVAPEAYRFQILDGANDRMLNLQLYEAFDPNTNTVGTGTEVKMVASAPGNWPIGWPTPDARDGGWPDPLTVGPSMVQIGTEGGLLPAPAVIQNRPIGYEYNRRDIVVLNVAEKALFLGPAERAEVVVDFSSFAGKTLILYNDAPAPVPAFDSRLDYYTGDPDQVLAGGAPTTVPGYGPNTRTMMQIVVDKAPTGQVPFNLGLLTRNLPGIFQLTQDPVIVPEMAYGATGNTYSTVQATSLDFPDQGATTSTSHPMTPKAIQELFTLDYGRMNATLGVELPFTSFMNQTTIPFGYIDPPTEILQDGVPQIWKITHNGVDTHAIHFHLFSVQLINRVGWDGAIRPPDPNELGWKDTVRMNPLEDVVVALRPMRQATLPWPIPDSIRPLDVTQPIGGAMGFSTFDPNNNPISVKNDVIDFGWEYVWHCHLLGHEENDMMRAMILQVPPEAPSNLVGTLSTSGSPKVTITWTNNAASETGFVLQRATDAAFTKNLTSTPAGTPAAPGGTLSYSDRSLGSNPALYYRVQAINDRAYSEYTTGPVTKTLSSGWSNTAAVLFVPVANVVPTLLVFGNQAINTTSGTQTVTLSNTGALSLTISRINIGGTNPGDFGQVNSCGTTLAASASCKISVTFKPTVIGARSASLTVASNDPVHPSLTVVLSGTGLAAGPPPAAPSNLTTALQGASSIVIRWKNNATNQAGFYLERSLDGITWIRVATVAANVTSYTDNGLNRRTTYWYRLQAFNASGNSAYSNAANATTR